jgi:hypothetical protein
MRLLWISQFIHKALINGAALYYIFSVICSPFSNLIRCQICISLKPSVISILEISIIECILLANSFIKANHLISQAQLSNHEGTFGSGRRIAYILGLVVGSM